jgi:Cu+-exporting ATPase
MEMSEQTASSTGIEKMALKIEGMHCASCVATIEKSLLSQDGVIRASVSLLDEKAIVEYESGRTSRESLEHVVDSTGYRARRLVMRFNLDPIPDERQWKSIESSLVLIPGVLSARGSRGSNRLLVEYDDLILDPRNIRHAVRDSGFSVVDESATGDRESLARESEIRYYRNLLILSAALTIPVVLIMFNVLTPLIPAWLDANVVMFLLTTPIQFIGGYPFYKSSLRGLVHGKSNMDTLIMLGTTAAYAYSVAASFVLTGFMTFYDTSAMLITFILIGRWLEAMAKGRTSRAIRSLMDLQPSTAIVVRDGKEVIVPAEDVELGDIVIVKPGDRMPVDGEVVDGQSSVDESMITGESLPVKKKTSDEVIGGTINKLGSLTVKATRVGSDTALAQIIKLVEQAQSEKPPIQRRADAIAEVFVPVVLLIALITFTVWAVFGSVGWSMALRFTIAVLVAACPCALGLATPTAIMVGLGKGAQHGILIKTGAGLETIPRVDTAVFDKTGTLTVGQPSVADLITAGNADSNRALSLVASAEKKSEHPLADAIVRYAQAMDVPLLEAQDFTAESGLGISALVDGKSLLIGNRPFLTQHGIDISELEPHAETLESQGKTTVYAAFGGEALALLAISDKLKSTSRGAVAALKAAGVDVWMITGDRERTAKAVSKATGIENVMAEVLPADKAEQVKRLQESGRTVAFVGDGINDAVALAQADVGIALGSGTDVSLETGDIILVRDDLTDVVSGIELGKKTVSKIRQGFFWALIYNMILLPIAAGVFYPATGLALRPEFAALAMAMSSVSVVTNALLLGRYTPKKIEGGAAEETITTEPEIAVDPICKMDVETATAELYSDYEGRRYYFCSPYCKNTFDENPEQYKDEDHR